MKKDSQGNYVLNETYRHQREGNDLYFTTLSQSFGKTYIMKLAELQETAILEHLTIEELNIILNNVQKELEKRK